MTEAIKANLRSEKGSNYSKKLRASGRIPGVVYGQHSDTKSIDVELREIEQLLSHHGIGATVNVEIGEEKVFTMLKDVQKNLFKNQLLHIDFQELTKGETVKVSIPIHFVNKSKVEDSVNIVVEQVHSLDIEVLPKDLIEYYEVDVACLAEQPSILLEELDIFKDDKFTVFADGDMVVASITEAGVLDTEPAEMPDEVPTIMDELASKSAEE